MLPTLKYTQELTVISCCKCGMDFAAPEDWRQERVRDHAWFYCPNGHQQHYTGKSEAEKLREQLETEKRNAAFWRERKQEQERAAELARRQRDAYKGHATRLKKRVAKGKCPQCSCTFVNLAAHMKKQHPDYAQGEENDG